jgi:hypothetical protein
MRDVCLIAAFLVVGCSSSDSTSSGAGGAGGAGGAAATSTTSTTSTSTTTTTTSTTTTSTSTTSSGGDPFEAARVACITKINALRATKNLPPYARWQAAESCVDQQATSDEMTMMPHGAWIGGTFPSCNGGGQNECLGQGPGGIEACLDLMWAEKDQPGCAGCDACNGGYDPNCANCDFYGKTTGNVCGHYVNMSALYHTAAACGFSSLGGWDAINFQ